MSAFIKLGALLFVGMRLGCPDGFRFVGIKLGTFEIDGRKLGLLEGDIDLVSVGLNDGLVDGTVLKYVLVGSELIDGCNVGWLESQVG